MNRSIKILCVGDYLGLLESQCLLLERAGYEPSVAMAHDALDRIRSEVFDLIVLSMMGSEDELGAICRAAAETTGVLRTSDFTGPEELLRKIGELLNKGCRDSLRSCANQLVS